MRKIVELLVNFLLIFSIILLLLLEYMGSINYIVFYVPIILIAILAWLNGIYINKKVKYQKKIYVYFVIYFITLFATIFLINRFEFSQFNIDINNIQLIPFSLLLNTILNNKLSILGLLFNYLGNFVMFIPFSLLLIIKNKKYYSYKKMFIILFIVTFIIEFLQLITDVGQFDIDDFIFNISGGIFTLFIIKKFNLFDFLNKVFYSNLNINKIVLKWLLFIISSFIIFIDILLIFKIIKLIDYNNDTNYIRGLYSENYFNKITIDNYEIYLDGVIVVYKNKSGEMYELGENLNITYQDLINLLNVIEENENYVIYSGKNVYGYECKNINRFTFTTYSYNQMYCLDN